eukprot:560199-Rhodomonas_salina.2
MPRSPNAHAPSTLASDVLDLDQSEKAHSVLVEGVGLCISAVDFVSVVCNKSRKDAHNTIASILKNKDANEVARLLCRKVDVKGFLTPTYVVTYYECFDLLEFLPRKRVRGVRKYIDKQFARLRAGDQSLHAEIDGRAANTGLEANLARSSLGMPLAPTIASDTEENVLKKRRMLAEVIELEERNKQMALQNKQMALENLQRPFEVAEVCKASFERLLGDGAVDDRDRL